MAFTGFFVAAVGLGFAVRIAAKDIPAAVAASGADPEVSRSLLHEALISPVPIVLLVTTLGFFVWFIVSGIRFLLHANALMSRANESMPPFPDDT